MPIICIDGINGAGKTTQAGLLAARVREEVSNAEVSILSDPGVRPDHNAEQIRRAARMGVWEHELTRAFLFMAARCELIAEIKKIQSNERAWIILDRYMPSFCVYQLPGILHACGRDMTRAIECINMLHRVCCTPIPDLTFILEVDPVLGIERYQKVAHDAPDVFERSSGMLHTLHCRYQQLMDTWSSFAHLGDVHCVEVGEMSAEDVHERMWITMFNYLQDDCYARD